MRNLERETSSSRPFRVLNSLPSLPLLLLNDKSNKTKPQKPQKTKHESKGNIITIKKEEKKTGLKKKKKKKSNRDYLIDALLCNWSGNMLNQHTERKMPSGES